jgi:hypothetical protein
MTTIDSPAIPVRWRRLLPAAIFAAAVALGSPAIASAKPNTGEWDIGTYDECLAAGGDTANCCVTSGGVWNGAFGKPQFTCVAPAGGAPVGEAGPPAEEAERAPGEPAFQLPATEFQPPPDNSNVPILPNSYQQGH